MDKQELLDELSHRIRSLMLQLDQSGVSHNSVAGGIIIGLQEAFALIEGEDND